VNALPEVESNDGVVHTTDIVGDVSKLTQFKSNSVDVAYASHVLEHISFGHINLMKGGVGKTLLEVHSCAACAAQCTNCHLTIPAVAPCA
jgi:hypothetical protein